jgi:hypothetical protein
MDMEVENRNWVDLIYMEHDSETQPTIRKLVLTHGDLWFAIMWFSSFAIYNWI